MFRGLSMPDIPSLKEGEKARHYRTNLWPVARGSELALYPNLTTLDPAWRILNRDLRFRHALSGAIDRRTLNNTLRVRPRDRGQRHGGADSPLYRPGAAALTPPTTPPSALSSTPSASTGGRLGHPPDGRWAPRRDRRRDRRRGGRDPRRAHADRESFLARGGYPLVAKPQEATNMRRRSLGGLTVMVAAQAGPRRPDAVMPPTGSAPPQRSLFLAALVDERREPRTQRRGLRPPEVQRLIELDRQWRATDDADRHGEIWREMLMNHARNTLGDRHRGRRPPAGRDRRQAREPAAKALYSWEPTALIGVQRLDEVFWDKPDARARRDDRHPPAPDPDDGGDAPRHLRPRLPRHQAAAGDYLSNRIMELRATGEAGSVAKADSHPPVRPRPAGLAAIPDVGRADAGPAASPPAPGGLGWSFEYDKPGPTSWATPCG